MDLDPSGEGAKKALNALKLAKNHAVALNDIARFLGDMTTEMSSETNLDD